MTLDPHIARKIEERAGLVLSAEQTRHLAQYITGRTERLKLTPEEYRKLLSGPVDREDSEISRLIRRVTVGETWFYRDAAQFDALRMILRELSRTRKRPISIWSAPCATGEEAYSLAMVAQELNVEVRVLGTDIDDDAIRAARRGVYEPWALRRMPERLRRYFDFDGDLAKVNDEVRSSVRFETHNLISEPPRRAPNADGLWDVVFCRNLFIYFARSTVDRVARELLDRLMRDGWLFTAAAEHLEAIQVGAVLRPLPETFAYQRAGEGAAEQAFPAISPLASPLDLSGRLSEDEEVASTGDRLTDPEPESELDLQLTSARRRLTEKQSEEALEILRQAEMAQPLVPDVHYYLALAHRRLGNAEEYGAELRRTLFLAPDYWPAAFLLAGHHERRDECSAAASAYRRVLSAIAKSRIRVFDPLEHDEIVLSKQQIIELCEQKIETMHRLLEGRHRAERENERGQRQQDSDRRRQ